ncbi:3-hydroxypropanoate dehydrogenase [Saccharothrix ecbatanensis]|jgi:3-hydroxypropanoate dehydrogenase|uniref:3-hydroxypropanoate dehydrogenase n=1 Tax=Saccharothrix ecbatanensis TaxID=1105145 RepID=A0A7W9HMS9_9PSEU|nr:malonic semialdehyde reductase [Saccharothrix ecbatanensis]MBB5805025.1 3-hydroxypropanoate dehydrogenase [Saccharothrix ecbatanensis]
MTTTFDALALPRDAQDLLFREARTANAFTAEPVTDEQLREVYELVKWGPTSMNSQPLRVLFVRGEEAKARLAPHMSEGNRAKTASAPVTAILSADTDFHEHFPRTFPNYPGAKAAFADDAGRTEAAKMNALLQVGYFILGVRAAGLAAGPMSGFDKDGVRREFFADTTLLPLVIVNIGHPDHSGTHPRNPRLDYAEAVSVI